MTDSSDDRPLTYKIAMWYGYVFSGVFLLYGGVKIILSILDRNYQDIFQPIFFVVMGVILISFVFAYRELKSWGWYGLLVINCLVVIGAIIGYDRYENIVLLILSVVALYALFAPATKSYLFKRR